MEKINELKDLPEFIIDPKTGKKIYKPSDESIKEWCNRMDILYQRFLQLQKEGRLSK
jgi:hypothetical protein